ETRVGEAGADDRLGFSGADVWGGLHRQAGPAAVADAADGGASDPQAHLRPFRRGFVRWLGGEPCSCEWDALEGGMASFETKRRCRRLVNDSVFADRKLTRHDWRCHHSIALSARVSSVSGKVTSSSLAALRLMTGSTFVTLIPVL